MLAWMEFGEREYQYQEWHLPLTSLVYLLGSVEHIAVRREHMSVPDLQRNCPEMDQQSLEFFDWSSAPISALDG